MKKKIIIAIFIAIFASIIFIIIEKNEYDANLKQQQLNEKFFEPDLVNTKRGTGF